MAMAAGLTIETDKIDAFRHFLHERLSAQVEQARANDEAQD